MILLPAVAAKQIVVYSGQWVALDFVGGGAGLTGSYQFVRRSVGCLDGGQLYFRSAAHETCVLSDVFAVFYCFHPYVHLDFGRRSNFTMTVLSYHFEILEPSRGYLLRPNGEPIHAKLGYSHWEWEAKKAQMRIYLHRLVDLCDGDCLWRINEIGKDYGIWFF